MVIRYRGTSTKLGSCQGECPYPILSSPLVVKKMVVVMKKRSCPQISMAVVHHHKRRSGVSLTGPATSSQTRTFKPCLIFKDLVLEVVDLALEEVDLLVEGEGDVLHGISIHLEITRKFRDHEVIGIESTLHHPLAPKDFLLHSFKPSLH